MSRNACLAAALWAALFAAVFALQSAGAQENAPSVGPPHSLIVPPDCKANLEYAHIPAAEQPLSALGDCVYDFLAFIDKAQRITVRGQDGFMKRSVSFFDAHMTRYASALDDRLSTVFPGADEFAQRRKARAREKALQRESALVRDYIERTRDRRRYYVDGVSVVFSLDGPYDFDSETYGIQARVISNESPTVFYRLCELRVGEIPLTFTLPIDPKTAERISRKRGEHRIDIARKFWVVPGLQGVYDPSWLFRGTRYVATARLDVGPKFIEEAALRVKKWYFLSE